MSHARLDTQLDSESDTRGDGRQLEGIEGWLIWPALFLVTVAFTVADYLLDSTLAAQRPEVMAGNIAVLVGSVVALVLYFQKRSVVPALMVVFYVTLVGVCVVEVLSLTRFSAGLAPGTVAAELADARNGLGLALGHAIIWIPYFLVSERVRNTFVE